MIDINAELEYLRSNEWRGEPSDQYCMKSPVHHHIAAYYCYKRATECDDCTDEIRDASISAIKRLKDQLAIMGYIILDEFD